MPAYVYIFYLIFAFAREPAEINGNPKNRGGGGGGNYVYCMGDRFNIGRLTTR